jgi:hypothetical protein
VRRDASAQRRDRDLGFVEHRHRSVNLVVGEQRGETRASEVVPLIFRSYVRRRAACDARSSDRSSFIRTAARRGCREAQRFERSDPLAQILSILSNPVFLSD